MNDRVDFRAFASRVAAEQGCSAMLPVVEKELLHYEILQALEAKGLLETIVFQGGTCLRLCYGADRYSEDLDFAGGPDFDGRLLREAKTEIEQMLQRRYVVEVRVSEPKKSILEGTGQISITTAADRRDIPKQRISLQIASVPAYTRQLRTPLLNYPELPSSYSNLILISESLEEICADKIVSFVCASHVRYRDLWDLRWLAHRPGFDMAQVPELVGKKLLDYGYEDRFKRMRSDRLKQVPAMVESQQFMDQMRRFLPIAVVDATLARPKFRLQMSEEITGLYRLLGV